ncbi:MAG: glycosyltransferase family 2 protein [Bryobacterales bacterium]
MALPSTVGSVEQSSVEPHGAARPDRKTTFAVLCPVFDDWPSFRQLVREIASVAPGMRSAVTVLAVDDGSSARLDALDPDDCAGLERVEVIRLLTNLGHQRAIATGLAELRADSDFDAVVVMDADGEDRPEDLPRLLELHRANPDKVIVINRAKRTEGFLFRALYVLYKALFWLLTGTRIRNGNFTLAPRAALAGVLSSASVWNNFAGSVRRARAPKLELSLPRGKRYAGKSKMNLVSLVVHGLSAVSVYADVVMVRVVVLSGVMALLSLLALITVVVVRYLTDLAIPGWATNAAGLALVMLVQNVVLSLIASFILLSLRSQPTFLPLVDARRYVESRQTLYAKPQ